MVQKIEDGDEEALRIFGWFKGTHAARGKTRIRAFGRAVRQLCGRELYNDKIPAVLDELREKNLLEQSEGAFVVRLDEEGLPRRLF